MVPWIREFHSAILSQTCKFGFFCKHLCGWMVNKSESPFTIYSWNSFHWLKCTIKHCHVNSEWGYWKQHNSPFDPKREPIIYTVYSSSYCKGCISECLGVGIKCGCSICLAWTSCWTNSGRLCGNIYCKLAFIFQIWTVSICASCIRALYHYERFET